MSDSFVPLDMSAVYNAGVGNVESEDGKLWPAPDDAPDHTPLVGLPWGEQLFWGVPFRLAAAGAAKAVVLVAQQAGGAVSASVEIPINAEARRILYAHACAPVPGAAPTVEGTGEAIGTYRVLYADGSFVEQRLRRRFEIHDVQVPWGHHPFLCRNCRHFYSVPLDSREHGYGMVQTGAFTREGSDLQGDETAVGIAAQRKGQAAKALCAKRPSASQDIQPGVEQRIQIQRCVSAHTPLL